MTTPKPSDFRHTVPKWMRRISVLYLLSCIPLQGCDKGSPEGDDEAEKSSEDENEGSENEDSNKKDESPGEEKDEPKSSEDESKKKDKSKDDDGKDGDGKDGDGDGKDGDGKDGDGKDGDGKDGDGKDGDGKDGDGKDDPKEDPEEDPKEDPEEDPKEDPKEEEKPKRDCEKIAWGQPGTKVGSIVARKNVQGYVDTNGDEKVETTPAPAGMCELHLMDKKRCGLVVYGAGKQSG